MQHENFVHLHLHTQYSLLDGACFIPQLMEKAREYRMPAIAMTDHGNLFGAIEFYDEALKHGIKPILGCEIYIAPGNHRERTTHRVHGAAMHMTLLAKDEVGYKNLMTLVSKAYLEGFYYKPRIDKELLQEYREGLIALSGCLKGEVPHLLMLGQNEQAKEAADFYRTLLGKDNFYLELHTHGLPEQEKVARALLDISKDLEIPVVATNDVHYLHQKDAKAHDALICIQTQALLSDPHRMRYQTPEFYFKSPQEMADTFREIPQALRSTVDIAERCNVELDFSKIHLPSYEPPQGKSREAFLRELCYEGLTRRYGAVEERLTQRLEQELAVIQKAGFTSYFLITWDFVRYAKEKGIPVGPGRGSVAGSLVSHTLGITDLDPLRYGLLFERFLNPERVHLPDIDIDFCFERRQEVIDYVTQKYSPQNVAQIITFGTMQARGVIRDVGRVMNLPYPDVDRIAKLVPMELNIRLKDAIDQEPELKRLHETDPKINELLETSLALEGLSRHASTHAAGVVISDRPLSEYMPLFKSGEGQITTGYEMKALEKIGLLKIDFLGLRTLTVIEETLRLIEASTNQKLCLDTIPLDDAAAYQLLARAETIGVFQLESTGMRDLLRKMGPTRFEDLIALLALFRPGPIGSGMLDDFISRKHNASLIRYDHPKLEPILKETYGICIYQEQVMRIANEIAGFNLSDADLLRQAMAKKLPEMMTKQRAAFIDGAMHNGLSQKVAERIFNLIEYFSGYGFNKSHSTAYALISYRTAYLKAHTPVEFMTALLTSEKDNTDKIVQYTNEATRMGIKILPPNINESDAKFTRTPERQIRFGLSAVKNVGLAAIESILEARQTHGVFRSLFDFTEGVDLHAVNRKVIESLIKCGAFDEFGCYRSQLMALLDQALESASRRQKDKKGGQLSFFDLLGEEGFKKGSQERLPNLKEWPENQLLSFEKELLGFYVTGHPLARYEPLLKTYSYSSDQLPRLNEGATVWLGGIIIKAKFTVTKKTQEKMAILLLEDLSGATEVIVFPATFSKTYRFIKENAVVFIQGRLTLKEERPKVMAEDMMPVESVRERMTQDLSITLVTAGLEQEIVQKLKGVLEKYPGTVPVYLNFKSQNREDLRVLVNRNLYVRCTDALLSELEAIVGKEVIELAGSIKNLTPMPAMEKRLDNQKTDML